jgi:broad specificity phosphatase PhoE
MIYLHLLNQPESSWIKEDRCEGTSDTSLTPLGKKQTVMAGMALLTQDIKGIIVGRLHRTVQTGKLLIKIFPLKLNRDVRLNDMNYGRWQGKFPEEIETRFPEEHSLWKNYPQKLHILEGEPLSEVQNRVHSFLESLYSNELFDQHYIIVTHDIIIRIILTLVEGKKLKNIWDYTLVPASISKVCIYPDKKIIEINNVEHLKRKELAKC